MAKVTLKNITKYFDKKLVLDDIDLEIKDREFVVLLGPSGCGKSTLLRMIAGLEKPSFGEIFIGNQCVNNIHPKDRDIAMVFQNYALYPHLDVYDNMAFGLRVRKMARCEVKRRVLNAADVLGLEEYLDSKPKELSGGQRQRVALGRAMVREPKVFLMDEPLSNLDAKLRVQMRSEIKKLHKKLNATFIYVTHDQTEAMTMGDKIVVLDKGVIQQVGSAQEIYNNPKNTFVASFMGSYPMNLLPATLDDGILRFGNVIFDLKTTTVSYPQNKKNLIVGIRYEDIASKQSPAYPFNMIKFGANVEFEEILGSQKNIYFKMDKIECMAQVPADLDVSATVNLSINPKQLKFFDVITKEALN